MSMIIGTRWNENYEQLLFNECLKDNPKYTSEHKLSCAHITVLSPEELAKQLDSYCTVCGRQIKIIKQKTHIIVKNAESWVVNYDKDDITKLVIRNPYTLDEYKIITNRNSSKKWIYLSKIDENKEYDINIEKIQAFRSFLSKIFKTEISVNAIHIN